MESPYFNQNNMFKTGTQSSASELEIMYASFPRKHGGLQINTQEVLQVLNESTP